MPGHFNPVLLFQSTLPVWGATGKAPPTEPDDLISIHAPRVGSDSIYTHRYNYRRISIHAPRVGSDPSVFYPVRTSTYFNPRSPCGERPATGSSIFRIYKISIHAPRVGSDVESDMIELYLQNFNPRSPCGERLFFRGM